jgi:mono/diheme cytochrome c family protein
VAALALGPDGIYFAPILPGSTGVSSVYRVIPDPGRTYPHRLATDESGAEVFARFGCGGCHTIGGIGTAQGPALDRGDMRSRLTERLASAEYQDNVDEVDRLTRDPFPAWRDERHAVLDATGDEQLRRWITYRIREPRFDDPDAAMPRLGLTERQASVVADYLLGIGQSEEGAAPPEPTLTRRVRNTLTSKRFAAGVVAGFAAAAALGAGIGVARRLRRRRAHAA